MTNRLHSLDIFRGIAIAGMIIVNNQGDWSHVYAPLKHAAWHGFGGADIIFPFFLFIAGVSLSIALSGKLHKGEPAVKIIKEIAFRSFVLFMLGIILNLFPRFDPGTFRIPGVLQRIAFCYFAGSLIFLFTGWRTQIKIVCVILFGYWLVLTRVTPYGFGAGSLDPEGNICRYVDSLVFANHTYEHAPVPGFDPEGLLSTFSSVATIMLGILAGTWLQSGRPGRRIVTGCAVAGIAGIAAGAALDFLYPINKNLWTGSFVIFTAGISSLFLAAIYYFVEIAGFKRWTLPFLIFGRHSLSVFFLSSLAGRFSIHVTVPWGRGTLLKNTLHEMFFLPWLDPYTASLAYSIAFLTICLVLTVCAEKITNAPRQRPSAANML